MERTEKFFCQEGREDCAGLLFGVGGGCGAVGCVWDCFGKVFLKKNFK